MQPPPGPRLQGAARCAVGSYRNQTEAREALMAGARLGAIAVDRAPPTPTGRRRRRPSSRYGSDSPFPCRHNRRVDVVIVLLFRGPLTKDLSGINVPPIVTAAPVDRGVAHGSRLCACRGHLISGCSSVGAFSGGTTMNKMTRRMFGVAGFALMLATSASFAQQPPTVRVR